MATDKMSFDGEELLDSIQELPGGAPKMGALLEAIRQADEAKEDFWRLYFRYIYAYEATFRDDATKAISTAAEFSSIFEENQDALGDIGGETYLMITQMGIDPILFLPQITKAQWEKLMEQFYILVQRYGLGMRTYWWQMTRFWQYIDKEKSLEYFEKFWDTERDDLSDCEACEYSYGVRMSLLMGNKEEADRYMRPLEEQRISLCSDVPQSAWLAYLEDALDRGDLEAAAPLADKLYRKGSRDKSDLSYIGAALRCWAYTNSDKAIARLTQHLEWTIDIWDQKKLYDFYKGAWVCFREKRKKQDKVVLDLPKKFPLYREDRSYSTRELEEWFYRQVKTISQRFDQRNGSDYFAKDMALACACEKP